MPRTAYANISYCIYKVTTYWFLSIAIGQNKPNTKTNKIEAKQHKGRSLIVTQHIVQYKLTIIFKK
jgi:hypothetical protein